MSGLNTHYCVWKKRSWGYGWFQMMVLTQVLYMRFFCSPTPTAPATTFYFIAYGLCPILIMFLITLLFCSHTCKFWKYHSGRPFPGYYSSCVFHLKVAWLVDGFKVEWDRWWMSPCGQKWQVTTEPPPTSAKICLQQNGFTTARTGIPKEHEIAIL